jgi:hypothetical protein
MPTILLFHVPPHTIPRELITHFAPAPDAARITRRPIDAADRYRVLATQERAHATEMSYEAVSLMRATELRELLPIKYDAR